MANNLLAKNGRSDWHIIMAHPVHETIKLAAHELQKFLMQMSGASLPTQTELQPKAAKEILVGRSSRLAEYGIEMDWDSLGEEGFVMKTGENWLLLAGATPRGTLYAVYAFLEEIMGIRWLASDCTVIPTPAELVFPELDRVEKPAFESREAYWSDAFDGDYAVRNRMNSNKADISIRQGGRMKFYNFHHSFDELINYRDYFDTHPEYFSEVEGKRLNGPRTQLCLTNPDVLKLAIAKVRQWIQENPLISQQELAERAGITRSSVGVHIVNTEDELDAALADAAKYGKEILVEEYIKGKELTVAIFNGEALPVVHICPRSGFYDMNNKYPSLYGGVGSDYICPADISEEETKAVQAAAVAAYKALNVEVYGRVDVLLTDDGKPYVLEINTLPGLTGASLFPKAALAAGISYGELCTRIAEVSLNQPRG